MTAPITERSYFSLAKLIVGPTKGFIRGKALSVEGHAHSASNITSGTLPIARGGTGATTAAAARSALGAAAASHTHDNRYYTETEMNSKLQEVKDMISVTTRSVELLASGYCRINGNVPASGTWNTAVSGLPSNAPDFMRVITLQRYYNDGSYSVGVELFAVRNDSDKYAILIPSESGGTRTILWYHGTVLQWRGESASGVVRNTIVYEIYKYV